MFWQVFGICLFFNFPHHFLSFSQFFVLIKNFPAKNCEWYLRDVLLEWNCYRFCRSMRNWNCFFLVSKCIFLLNRCGILVKFFTWHPIKKNNQNVFPSRASFSLGPQWNKIIIRSEGGCSWPSRLLSYVSPRRGFFPEISVSFLTLSSNYFDFKILENLLFVVSQKWFFIRKNL